jgi:hypothetical protein
MADSEVLDDERFYNRILMLVRRDRSRSPHQRLTCMIAREREHAPAAEPRERLRKDFGASKRLGHPVPFPREARGITNFAQG